MIQIRPEVAIYSAFSRLNYSPWYALAEFVDNAVQSYLSNRDRLRAIDAHYQLTLDIDISDEAIEIRDNAAGIQESDYARAFIPASPPPDSSGLSEYGIGMKAAACWFSKMWSVRTTAIGEAVERTVTFDVPAIVESHLEELSVLETLVDSNQHYTCLRLTELNVKPKSRTLTKIRSHLASIYRVFIREKDLILRINAQPLKYEEPEILLAPPFDDLAAQDTTWRKEFSLDLDDSHKIRGWAGILAKASVTNAGFALFRRNRLIEGSYGEGYRPERIFRKSNSFTYQRLVGEIQVEGFVVSHTKDGIQWSEWEDDILSWLKKELNEPPVELLKQAEGYRAKAARPKAETVRRALDDAAQQIEQHLPPILGGLLESVESSDIEVREERAPSVPSENRRIVEILVQHARRVWKVTVELADDPSYSDWLGVRTGTVEDDQVAIQTTLNLAHPFMRQFVRPAGDELIPFTRLAAAIAIAEQVARESGVDRAGAVRRHLNDILRGGLSGPVNDE